MIKSIKNLRWWIAGLIAAATALNYLDRQNFPVAITEMQKHIPVSNSQYAQLQFLFLLAYGLMYIVGGKMVDWLGSRWGYAVMIFWWSAANLMHGFVSNVFELGFARFFLGLGEGGGFPASAKTVSEWFPAKERSFAFGIFNTGSSVGAVIAPPLIAVIILNLGWRWVFFITGLMGFVWVGVWLLLYRLPSAHPMITADERSYLAAELPPEPSGAHIRWRDLLRYRQAWGVIVAKALSDSAWYFFIFWLPKYLADVRGLNIKEIGAYAWIPYAFAGGGSLIGGWLSSYLIKKRVSLDTSRKISLAISAFLMPISLFIVRSPLSLTILFFGIAMFGSQFWSTIVQTLVADMFPSQVVGSVTGLMGAAGSFGGMFFNLLVGSLLASMHTYSLVFILAGVLHPLAFFSILAIVRHIERIPEKEPRLALG